MVIRKKFVFIAPNSKHPIEVVAESQTTALDRLRKAKVETRALKLESIEEVDKPTNFQLPYIPMSTVRLDYGVRRLAPGNGFGL